MSILTVKHYTTASSKILKNLKKKKFIDTLKIQVQGGVGGQGLPNYGGIGGRGGMVYLVGTHNMSLKKLQQENLPENARKKILFKAGNGENSKKYGLLGKPGEDTEVPVPPGVTVTAEKGQLMGEVLAVGDKLLVAKGGDGGQLSNGFQHTRGHSAVINMELKLIADIGLVGFPNAGKSSLIKSLSRMKVKIKPYPFTTITPQVGVMKYPDHRQISVADLPGLIEGAHYNYGMGHDFLKHIERTKLLLFVIDLHGFQFKVDTPHRTPFESVLILLKEMELSRIELLSKPAALVINKIDIPGSEEKLEGLIHKISNMKDHLHEVDEIFRPDTDFKFDNIMSISARENKNINKLKEQLRTLLDVYSEERREIESPLDSLKLQLTESATSSTSGTWV